MKFMFCYCNESLCRKAGAHLFYYEGHPINSRIFLIIYARLQFVYKECSVWVAILVSHTTNSPKCLYAGRLDVA